MTTTNAVPGGDEFDCDGFHVESRLHRDTGTEFNPQGYNANGYDADGYDREGRDAEGYDREGFDEAGYDREGHDEAGFDADGIHSETGTEFGHTGRTRNGSRYNSQGCDRHGYDREGYNEEGYDASGYNCDGEDEYGNTRCDNGDCDDDCCELCHPSGGSDLLDYSDDVCEETGWTASSYAGQTTVAFEFECNSHDTANEAIEPTAGEFNAAYRACVNKTRSGRGAIAKRDGSLDDNSGLEVVTVPTTLAEMRLVLAKAFPSGKFGGGAVSAWRQDECGMHVHVGRRSITPLTLGKMLVFMHSPTNKAFCIEIAGRNTHYAAYRPHRAMVKNGTPEYADQSDKYSSLHVKRKTVEFRIFRPSCRVTTILKNLCFCLAVREFCIGASINRLSWQDFLAWLAKPAHRATYAELHVWLRDRSGEFGDHYRSLVPPKKNPPATGSAS